LTACANKPVETAGQFTDELAMERGPAGIHKSAVALPRPVAPLRFPLAGVASRLRSRPLPGIALYGIQACIALAIFIAGFGSLRFLQGWPTNVTGDAMHHVMLAKAIIEQGWYWHIERLSAPFTLPMIMFPVGGLLDTILFKVISIAVHDPFALVTYFFALTFVLSAVTSAYVLHDLGVERPVALVFGLAFAFAPFPFARSVAHLMLVIYLVPFAVGFCIHLIEGTFAALPRGRKTVYYLGAGALGLNYVYTAFFACYFVLLAMMARLFRPHAIASLRYGALFIAIAAGSATVALTPALLSAWKDPAGRAELYGYKSVTEADIHGLKIKHLLMPAGNSSVPAIQWARKKFTEGFPLEHENQTARLGIIGAAGFLMLMIAALLRLTRPRATIGSLLDRLGAPAALTIGGIFLATIGGLGSIFNAFVTTEIRAYNRISPFLLFLGIAAFAYCFRHVTSARSGAARAALLAAVLALALLEQPDFRTLRDTSAYGFATIADLTPVVDALERKLPKGAAVYQMPFMVYPHTPFVRGMLPNDHLHAYAISHHLRWSWPALSGEAIALNRDLEKLPPAELAPALAKLGFAAVWINRSAYEDRGASVIDGLKAAGLVPIAESVRGTVIALDLAPVRARVTAQ
jgi:phosphoglycerol transferase